MKRFSCGHSFLLGVDKPLGLSSHDVVARARRAVGESKVGHAGTLDPLASGILILGLGQATRLLGLITLDDKRYLARISFGSETTTDDAEGEVVRTAPADERFLDAGFAQASLDAIVGAQEQVPPSYSAVSVDGRRAYDSARKGLEVELPARSITIYEALLLSIDRAADGIVWTCAFHVSKGTYIRSIARDLGRSLGSAAHLCALRRTTSGSMGLDSCISLDALQEGGLEVAYAHAIDPLKLLPYPARTIAQGDCASILNGKAISGECCEGLEEGSSVCLVREGRLWSIASLRDGLLVASSNFPQGIEGVRR